MLYDFDSLSLSARTVRRCSSENHRSTDHLLDRIYTIRQPLTVNDCFTTPIHDLVYNSTNHEVNLYFFPPLSPGNCSATFSEVSICRIIECIIGDIEYEKSLRNRKWSSHRAHMARRQFSARTECKWSVDEFIMEESVYPRGQAATIFCVTAFLSCGQSQ